MHSVYGRVDSSCQVVPFSFFGPPAAIGRSLWQLYLPQQTIYYHSVVGPGYFQALAEIVAEKWGMEESRLFFES